MLNENCYKRDNISFGKTIRYIGEDNVARLVFMGKSPTLLNSMASLFSPNMMVISIYRLSHYFHSKKIGFLARLLYMCNITLFGCEIVPSAQIGPGLCIAHVVGIVIHAKIGKNAILFGQNVFGGRGDEVFNGWLGGPVVGDNVTFGFGSKAFGYIEIGDDVFVAAMSLVTRSVPNNAVVAGVPAKVSSMKRPSRAEHKII